MPFSLRAILSTSRLKKKFSFIFCPWKEFRTHVSKIVWLFSNSLFFRVAASQNWFLARTPVCTTIESLNLTAFVEGAATAIVELTELSLATSCKIYLEVPRQNMETSLEIIFIPAWSEETLPFDLNLHIKNSPIYQIGLKSISVGSLYTNDRGHWLPQIYGYLSGFYAPTSSKQLKSRSLLNYAHVRVICIIMKLTKNLELF